MYSTKTIIITGATRYSTIDYLFCNAGILCISQLNYSVFIKSVLNGTIFDKLRTGHDLFTLSDAITNENLYKIFATNTLGHFVLIQELLPILASGINANYSHIIWSTSMAAHKKYFSIDDIMCRNGKNPYASSKHIINNLSVAINLKYNSKNLYSSLAEPGLVVTAIGDGALPAWLWKFATYLFCMLRVFLSTLTVAPYYASEVLVWLFKQNPSSLNRYYQYNSNKGLFGSAYVDHTPLLLNPDEAITIYEKMKYLEENFRKTMKI